LFKKWNFLCSTLNLSRSQFYRNREKVFCFWKLRAHFLCSYFLFVGSVCIFLNILKIIMYHPCCTEKRSLIRGGLCIKGKFSGKLCSIAPIVFVKRHAFSLRHIYLWEMKRVLEYVPISVCSFYFFHLHVLPFVLTDASHVGLEAWNYSV
jgi:hypothetical protein